MTKPTETGTVRAGTGGWIYAPWRGVFYPKGLRQADELAYATSHLTTIEISGVSDFLYLIDLKKFLEVT